MVHVSTSYLRVWEHPKYARKFCEVQNIAIVNDAVERDVKDIQDYANAAMDRSCMERMILVSNSCSF